MKEIIFGFDCVSAALSAHRRQIYKLLLYQSDLVENSKTQSVLEAAVKRKVPIQYTTRKELDNLLENRPHQNVALEVSRFDPPVISSPPSRNGIFVFPVNLLDPQNLGSIIRSAAFYGCAGLITNLKHSCDYTPIVSKASAGSMELFDGLFRTKSPLQFIKSAKEAGFHVIGTGLSREIKPVNQTVSCNPKILLLLGNEGAGLSPEILSLCDENLVIPSRNSSYLDSLNVGVATGILLDHMINYSALLPPAWKEIYLPFWFQEDFVGLDVASAVLGDAQGSGQILFKSDKGVLAGRPFFDGVFNFMNCDVNWLCGEGEWINCPQAIAIVTGPASNLLKAERLALNLLARCSTIATNARALANESAVKLAGTRKTTPGFRLVEKYALLVGGVDTHRFNCTDCVMLKDNHVDLLKEQGIDLAEAISLVKQAASFTAKVEVECRSVADAQISIQSGADIVMLDNFIPSADEISGLKSLNPRVIIELSGGINKQNIHLYPNDPSIILSLGEFTHSPGKLLDFSFKIIK